MNVAEIKMETWAARTKMREYAASVRRLRAERLAQAETDVARARLRKTSIELEDESLRRAYRALALEKRVLNLNTAMRAAGLTEKTRLPRLAIVRADCKYVELSANNRKVCFYSSKGSDSFNSNQYTEIPTPIFGYDISDSAWRKNNKLPEVYRVSAICPQIPPRYRPEPEKLQDHYLLFEPNWEVAPPDPDPFLLTPLGHGFFVIVAQWDMTPLEQSILEGRIGS